MLGAAASHGDAVPSQDRIDGSGAALAAAPLFFCFRTGCWLKSHIPPSKPAAGSFPAFH